LKMFFFEAEDGIRDWSVTGVQTCALPILLAIDHGYFQGPTAGLVRQQWQDVHVDALEARGRALEVAMVDREHEGASGGGTEDAGTEERRVGKTGKAEGWSRA